MPLYRTACFGDAPGVTLDARVEAVTPTDAADKSVKAHLPGRRIRATRGASINGMHYFAAYDAAEPCDEVIVTVKEL